MIFLPRFKKFKGKTFDVEFTKDEQAAINAEVRKQLSEHVQELRRNIAALVLWNIHTEYGAGKIRLRRFYDKFDKNIEELIKHYELDIGDEQFICRHLLKEHCGIDLVDWESK